MVTVPKWVWNLKVGEISREEIYRQFQNFKEKDGYEGVMIVLWNNDTYLSEAYFEKYQAALECAKELGMKILLWDENGFPSGYAGGLMEERYPQYCARRLDMEERPLKKGERVRYLPDKDSQGAVIYRRETGECVELEAGCEYTAERDGESWMLFRCVTAGKINGFGRKCRMVDYLDKEAVKKLLSLTHEAYYERFAPYFGPVISMAFYDEPSFWHVEGGRIWTEKYPAKFREKYGFSPVPLYPALFRDIGANTANARKQLLEFRAQLYSQEYIKTLADWCGAHHILLTGHQDQEEIVNPVPISGDLIKVFQYQQVPGVDEISYPGRGSKAYKLVSSAADQYGKQLVMCEVFGAMGEELDPVFLKKEALDLLAKGINFFVPHGTWYDNRPENIIFPPELSYRSEKFAGPVRELNDFLKSWAPMLQNSRHLYEAGILYPIEDLQASYSFEWPDAYQGGYNPPYSDYLELGEKLMYDCCRDFLFVHPENLELEPVARLKLLLVPGMRYISLSTLKKLKRWKGGGGKSGVCGPHSLRDHRAGGSGGGNGPAGGAGGDRGEAGDRPWPHGIFPYSGLPQSPQNGHFSYMRKEGPEGEFLFLSNSSDTELEVVIRQKSGQSREITLSPVSCQAVFL